MDGGQKIDINLEAPLDTKSSDMLVSVNDVRFAHNRQKYQGHVLPTSLRYERNGWAAGWYVYDFAMGGGFIFSRNEEPVVEDKIEWLAATRAKINNTPTYVISFRAARQKTLVDEHGDAIPNNRANIKLDPDAVSNATQFQVWHTLSASINARECEEALIDTAWKPTISFNYAIDGVDYKRKLKFDFDVINDTNEFSQVTDAYGSADLTAEYVDRGQDGTVTAVLNNNDVRWIWDEDVYIPKDLIDSDGYKFGKFVDVTNNVITWKLGGELLKYNDISQKFVYNDVNFNPDSDLSVHYVIPLTYTVPLHKYYSALNNITWSVQGNRVLFNNESIDNVYNKYKLYTDITTAGNINVYDREFSAIGIDGPDVALVSGLQLPITDLPINTGTKVYSVNSAFEENLNYMDDGTPCIVPVFNTTIADFSLTGNVEDAREVMIQVYYKYPGRTLNDLGIVYNREVRAAAMSYRYAAVGLYNEVIYGGNAVSIPNKYKVDGRYIDNFSSGLTVGAKPIWGRLADLDITITSLNASALVNPINLKGKGINSNMVLQMRLEDNKLEVKNNNPPPYAVIQARRFQTQIRENDSSNSIFPEHLWSSSEGPAPFYDYFSVMFEVYQTADHVIHFTLSDHNRVSTIRHDNYTYYEGSIYYGPSENYWPYCDLKLVNSPYGDNVHIIPLCRLTDEFPNTSTEYISTYKTLYLCAVHDSRSIDTDVNGYITPRYGFAVMKGDAPYAADEDVFRSYYSQPYHNNIDRQALVNYNNTNGIRLISNLSNGKVLKSLNMYTVLKGVDGITCYQGQYTTADHGSFATLNNRCCGGFVYLNERDKFQPRVPGYAADEYHILVQGVLAYNGTNVNQLLDVVYFHNFNDFKIDDIPETIEGSALFPFYWSNIPVNLRWPVGTINYAQINYLEIFADKYYWYIKRRTDPFWVETFNNTLNITGNTFTNNLCIDVIDVKTGERIIDHTKDVIAVSNASKLAIDLREQALVKGIAYFNKPANTPGEYSDRLSTIYNRSKLSSAFFPICKYKLNSSAQSSVYHEDGTFGGCQGVAVFNVSGIDNSLPTDYLMFLMSPLSSYILPPYLNSEDGFVEIFAGKTYTHHIKFNTDDTLNNISLIDDNTTQINRIVVSARDNVYNDNDSSPEINNRYYVAGSLLTPAAITYYNNQIHITYKPKAGNTVNIDGSIYDLSNSEMSIKQEADLTELYLPEHVNTKYSYAIGNHDDVLLVAETKDIINTIADTAKHWVDVDVTNIDFTVSKPVITLQFTEQHVSRSPVTLSVTYDDPLTINNAAVTEYSDENQLVIASSIDGDVLIHLPVMPEESVFKYDISDNNVHIIDSVDSRNRFKYNYNTNSVSEMYIKDKEVVKASIKLNTTNNDNQAYNVYSLSLNQNINTYIYFKHFGIYKVNCNTFDGRTVRVRSIEYNAPTQEYTFDLADLAYIGGMSSIAVTGVYVFKFNDFDDKEECTPKFLLYSATDVRDPNPLTQTKQFAKVMADNEYQLIKQHWDSTVATECFWWLDSTHTLELTKDRFIVKEKVIDGGYHDWMGDNWQVVSELNRTEYLTSEADTFIVSSASGKNAQGYLYILQPETETSIRVTIYNPLNVVDNAMEVVSSNVIEFKHIALGNKKKHKLLNEDVSVDVDKITVCTYSDIISSSLLADSKLTAVNIKGTHWLGIQYDKNLNQWAIAFGPGAKKVIQGYGCIGINCYATGGMLPAKYFDGTGFNSFVYDISELEAEEGTKVDTLDKFNVFNERIVGDENQQWYISDELSDIVMAVDLVKGTIIKLPITNKYSQVYASPSYVKYTVHALGIQIKQLMDMIIGGSDNPIWMDIIKYAMFPIVWYLSPYTNIINYLQQTIGQYAYTHYNSTSISRKSSKLHDEVDTDNAGLTADEAGSHIDALITDDLSFDVQHIAQEQSFKDNSWDNILGIFASMVVSATDMAMRDVAVNTMQNQSATSDIGKKFSQAFLQNIGSMSVTGFTMQSTKPMLKSEVTAVKTLDMFYSTSAEQNCFAGPGFVNMQFVAQCTAQSVTSVQLEAQQTQIFMLLKQLTTWQGKIVIYLLDQLKDLMYKMSDNVSFNVVGVTPGATTAFGWIAALVMSAVGFALTAAKAMTKLGLEVVDSILDSFFPDGVKTTVTAQLSRHNYDIEGKHAYGNKSEQFFWPCADCKSKLYTDESVEAVLQNKPWPLEMPTATTGNKQTKVIYQDQPACITETPTLMESDSWNGDVPYSIAMCKGSQKRRALPDSTAYVIGTESFMPTAPFKNENIGEGEPVFTTPAVQDYLIDKNWNLFVTAMAGDALWISCKDTKLFDGNYSNIIVSDDFCGVAAPHVAIEIKQSICEEYLRPWAVSPDAIALNITGLNCAYDEVAYHAFDGYGYRITDWLGASGMNKERYTWQYCFQINDRFKRSNKLPPNQFMGNFQALPSMSLDIKDKVFNEVTVVSEGKGLRTGVAGENKDTQRYSLPIFTEQISSLPAIVRALSPYKLAVIDGITSLTTDVRISQSVYKIPDSVDFNINDKLYRMTNEYICSVKHEKGLEVVEYLVPALGLTYLGATPFMAYFYNQATRQYYIYQGGNTLQVMDMLERFRDIKGGTYDFINQEVVMPCLATMTRLDKKVLDDADETDNIVIPVFRHNKVGGELTPPITTIFDSNTWYRTVSLASGLAFQGPNRCIINRFVWSQYMLEDIKRNKGKWRKVPREEYHPFRTYAEKFTDVLVKLDSDIKGWTHNPFLLVTSPLGVNEQTDCKFEWEITFAWTTEMEQIFEDNEYVTVNVMAETMCPGGKVFSRPTHIFLSKELFTRTENVGYYSFRYQSNNGAGNRERLHIWSDGYIAVSSIQLEYKVISEKRTEKLVIQEDIKGMKEM